VSVDKKKVEDIRKRMNEKYQQDIDRAGEPKWVRDALASLGSGNISQMPLGPPPLSLLYYLEAKYGRKEPTDDARE